MRKENTAERYYRHELNALLIVMLFYDLIAAVIVFFRVLSADGSNAVIFGDAWFWLLAFGLFPILCLPGLVYAFFRYRHYKSAELVNVQRVKLDQTDTVWRNCIGFRIKVRIDGTDHRTVTKHIFTTGSLGSNRLDDYIGKTVEVGYDEKTGEWIVFCLE